MRKIFLHTLLSFSNWGWMSVCLLGIATPNVFAQNATSLNFVASDTLSAMTTSQTVITDSLTVLESEIGKELKKESPEAEQGRVEKKEKNLNIPTPIELNTKAVKFVPYGFIRNDFYYDSRENLETASGLFYIIPKDRNMNEYDEDLNAIPSSRFLSIATRLGVKVYAQKPILKSNLMAQVEMDFAGFNGSTTMFRIRQAYMKMSWKKFSVLAGQTWHPMFGEVVPMIQSLATGCPFQPFNRSPQLRFDWKLNDTENTKSKLYFSALYQLQYTSTGPDGGTTDYLVKSKMPEFYLGFDWRHKGWYLGVGVDMLRIAPRTVVKDETGSRKVDERLLSMSANAFVQYESHDGYWNVKAKTIFGSNMSHLLLLSGYGVSGVDEDGGYSYTNIYNSTTWLNVVYGKKWQVGVFAGFMKNLGSEDPLYSNETTYIFGYNNVDAVYRVSPMLVYNIFRHFSFGLEYELTSVGYGALKLKTGRVDNTHWMTNHRAVGVIMFYF